MTAKGGCAGRCSVVGLMIGAHLGACRHSITPTQIPVQGRAAVKTGSRSTTTAKPHTTVEVNLHDCQGWMCWDVLCGWTHDWDPFRCLSGSYSTYLNPAAGVAGVQNRVKIYNNGQTTCTKRSEFT